MSEVHYDTMQACSDTRSELTRAVHSTYSIAYSTYLYTACTMSEVLYTMTYYAGML